MGEGVGVGVAEAASFRPSISRMTGMRFSRMKYRRNQPRGRGQNNVIVVTAGEGNKRRRAATKGREHTSTNPL